MDRCLSPNRLENDWKLLQALDIEIFVSLATMLAIIGAKMLPILPLVEQIPATVVLDNVGNISVVYE